MSASGVRLRSATPADDPAVGALIRSLDPSDYLLQAWPQWVRRATAVCLVAEARGSVVGCVYGEPTVGEDAWMQGARVDPRFRRLGVGSELMRAVQDELYRRGSRAVFGTISADNEASLAMVDGLGWRAVMRISRCGVRSPASQPAPHLAVAQASDVSHAYAVLRDGACFASRRELSYFRRRYFTMSREYVERMVELGAVHVSPDGRAVAVLDLEAWEATESLWVTALAGGPRELRSLLAQVGAEATRAGKHLLLDVPETAGIAAMLDEEGLDAADGCERFVVVRGLLDPPR